MKIYINKIRKLLKLAKDEKKYLSPYIYKRKNSFKLLYCNRENVKNFTGKIYSASSKNLTYWIKQNKPFLIPNKTSKYKSFISPNLTTLKNKEILFIEAQSYNLRSDIICFLKKKNQWSQFKKFKLMGNKNNFQSPFFFKDNGKNYLFYSKNKNKIERIELDNNLNVLSKNTCFKSSLKNEKYSIYSPTVVKFNSIFHMFYAAWTDKFTGNINYAYSKNGVKWNKKYINVFKFKKNIKIISEPFLYKNKNKFLLFFEYKNLDDNWNISFNHLHNKTIAKIK